MVVTMLAVVLGALMMPLTTAQKTETHDVNYAYAQQEERTGLDSMVSQIRQAYNILDTTSNSIDFYVNLNGVGYRVDYDCTVPQPHTSYHECVRVQVAAGSSLPSLGSGRVVIRNVLNGTPSDPVFTFAPDPAAPYYMTATIKVPASGGVSGGLTHSITLSDGALMRNENVGN